MAKCNRYNSTFKQRLVQTAVVLLLSFSLSGCFLTKIITVPLRIGGAVISIVPVVGNVADAAIDQIADVIDAVPL